MIEGLDCGLAVYLVRDGRSSRARISGSRSITGGGFGWQFRVCSSGEGPVQDGVNSTRGTSLAIGVALIGSGS